jgi:hypothetical protein
MESSLSESPAVLLIVIAVLAVVLVAAALIAKVVQLAMRRLGLEPMNVLIFFGLAEAISPE